MHRLLGMAFLVMLPVLNLSAQEATGTSTVTVGVGGGWLLQNPFRNSGGPVFDAHYEYRIRKYLAIETGVETTLSTGYFNTISPIETISTIGSGLSLVSTTGFTATAIRQTARSNSVPLGFRGILPVLSGKGELFLGASGAYIWSGNQYGYRAWAVESSLGARFAVDKQRHIWLGSTTRFSHDFGSSSQSWITWTADVGFRFGR